MLQSMAASELTQSSCPDNADADWCKKVKVKKIRVERKIIEKAGRSGKFVIVRMNQQHVT